MAALLVGAPIVALAFGVCYRKGKRTWERSYEREEENY